MDSQSKEVKYSKGRIVNEHQGGKKKSTMEKTLLEDAYCCFRLLVGPSIISSKKCHLRRRRLRILLA